MTNQKSCPRSGEQPSNDIRHRGHAAFFCFCVAMDVLLHGECYVGMAEDLRQGADILPTLHPERSERMAEGMNAAAFQFGLIQTVTQRSAQIMPVSWLSGGRRKYILLAFAGIFTFPCLTSTHAVNLLSDPLFLQQLNHLLIEGNKALACFGFWSGADTDTFLFILSFLHVLTEMKHH